MPEHGEYDPGLNQWYCSYWMSKELWMEIHDYSPPENKQPKPTDEGHTKSKTERTDDQKRAEKSSINNIFRSEEK